MTRFFTERQNKKIEKADDPLQQLQSLKRESADRLNNDYYNHRIENLELVFRTDITDDRNKMIVQQYRMACKQEINVLYTMLQMMDFTEQKEAFPAEIEVPEKCLYAFSKISDAVWSEEHLICFSKSPENQVLRSRFFAPPALFPEQKTTQSIRGAENKKRQGK